MKCTQCGAEISGKTVCGKCGMNENGHLKNIEVEYKDFKTSEFLEIRQTRPTLHDEEMKAAGGQTEISHQPPKRFYPIIAFALLLLALITGAFFIVRYLLLP